MSIKRAGVCVLCGVLLLAGQAGASVVSLDLTVNGGYDPVTINLGEQVWVNIYGTVTENLYGSTNLGLAGYGVGVLSDGGVLGPVKSGGDWDAAYYVAALFQVPGTVSGDDVLGHGAFLTSFGSANRTIAATTKTLLASGYFEGAALGTTSLGLGGQIAANVVWTTDGSTYFAKVADTINLTGGAEVTVTPEPATLTLLGLGLAGLVWRRKR